jgi:tRNA (mo5U34)-methyltransferase
LGCESVFDSLDALLIVEARQAAVRPILTDLRQKLGMRTAADVGCGIGRFSSFLQHLGFDVVGIDGREENVLEAKRRYASIEFHQANVEDASLLRLGSFDLVFCMGLLYHLENPLLVIRRLRALTQKGLLLESMCFPEDKPWMLLLNEPPTENQSLTGVAFYPSEGCLVKMLYRAGFSAVYRLVALPDHDDFRETSEHMRRRTVLFASPIPVESSLLTPLSEPPETINPWQKTPAGVTRFFRRTKKFFSLPTGKKYLAVGQRILRFFPNMRIPLRLPFGAWWLSRNDDCGASLRAGSYETQETAFVHRFLQTGMIVLDIGAHHGYYTMLASRRVGSNGQVIAFEPSPRERKALLVHQKLNRCKNVTVQGLALSNEEAEADLYVVQGTQTGFNSLRPPVVLSGSSPVRVLLIRLDAWLRNQSIAHVDFIKLDVEGAELSVLQGAAQLLTKRPRPVLLVEVQDIRTQPWGYRAGEIINYLSDKGYKWFSLSTDGSVEPLDIFAEKFDGNFVACPEESEALLDRIGRQEQ